MIIHPCTPHDTGRPRRGDKGEACLAPTGFDFVPVVNRGSTGGCSPAALGWEHPEGGGATQRVSYSTKEFQVYDVKCAVRCTLCFRFSTLHSRLCTSCSN